MNWSIIFAIAIALLLLRVAYLRIKANSVHSESFKNMQTKDQLAVLKECLLNNPSRTNIENLTDFVKKHGLEANFEEYKGYTEAQLRITRQKNAIAEDNELYAKESAWMDKLRPLEFAEAEIAKSNGDTQAYIEHSLEGIARLYSDEAIMTELAKLVPIYGKASALIDSYRKLIEARDTSGADDKSLEALRKQRDAWMDDLLTAAPN
ncbi:MAG: hypothetical protein IK012_11895 [Fibrobacter sp.]|uniref:hypothetical protein n=1 Tax=Fibrobacter sp. TaxID=35828 RepID=UPI0025B7B0C3|nr:hypothetical protein [Fibrobacter sp.]MBR4785934.1 hypothetical protein [Fibrobacter sp.]